MSGTVERFFQFIKNIANLIKADPILRQGTSTKIVQKLLKPITLVRIN